MSVMDFIPSQLQNQVAFLFEDAGDRVFAVESGSGTSALVVDVVDNEQHSWDNDVTSYPVEGSDSKVTATDISDNIRAKQDELTMSCFVSNSPISGLVDEVKNFADRMLNGRNRCQLVFSKLHDLRRLKVPVTVRTRYRVYTNMAITGITLTRQPENGESLTFDLRFKQIDIVKTQTTKVPPGLGKPTEPSTAKRAGVKTDAGRSTGKTVSPADAPKQVKVSGLAAAAGGKGYQRGYQPAVPLTKS